MYRDANWPPGVEDPFPQPLVERLLGQFQTDSGVQEWRPFLAALMKLITARTEAMPSISATGIGSLSVMAVMTRLLATTARTSCLAARAMTPWSATMGSTCCLAKKAMTR